MADYYPLIARAVAGLEKNTGDVRRALYERARTALVAQLRSTEPPLSETDITRERLALENAIRSVEADAARQPRGASYLDIGGADRGDNVDAPSPDFTASRMGGDLPSLSDQGLKGFRDTVNEAENLGGAAAKAGQYARDTYDAVPPSDYDRVEPRIDSRSEPRFQPPPEPYAAPHNEPHLEPRSDERFGERFEPRPETQFETRFEQRYEERFGEGRDGQPGERMHPEDYRQIPADSELTRAMEPVELSDMQPVPRAGPSPSALDELEENFKVPKRSYRRPIRIAVLAMAAICVIAFAYWQRSNLMLAYSFFTRSQPATVSRDAAAPPTARPKIADRVGGAPAPTTQPGSAPAATVAQKVVLYEEDAADPQGKRFVGSAIWRTETVSPGPGLAPELAIRADVEIPERKVKMTWSLRRNTDKALPASHTIEILFTLPADFDEGGIANVPGVLMKQAEQTRGVPLAGLAVKVTNNFFLVGLSAAEADLVRNLQLLRERSWFDIPVVYNNGRRGIIAVEKGAPGDRVFEEALRTWQQ